MIYTFSVSFSGLLEKVDEAVALTLGKDLGFATDEAIEKIVGISDNQVFPEMWKAYTS